MTHFNHEWDTSKTPAVPVSVGDRYYAQDLNDDFNYLKHLPYEVFLQGRTRGVMIAPNDTWNNSTNSLVLSGGFGVVSIDTPVLNINESFTIPPKTTLASRLERIAFVNTTLILPNDNAMHYIVASPTKRSFLQRTKALFTEQYASRVRYDGTITIQNTAPTAGQILVGLCHDKEYCLLIDNDPDQCKNDIILKKWFGRNKITQGFVSALQSYYSTSIASIKTEIRINTITSSINDGLFNHCNIHIGAVDSGYGINGGVFNDCTITISGIGNGYGINNGAFNRCTISIDEMNYGAGIGDGIFNDCTISIDYIGSADTHSDGINSGTFNRCNIRIREIDSGYGINNGTFNHCNIRIDAVGNGEGISNGTFNHCNIRIGNISSSDGVTGGVFNNCTIRVIGTISGYGVDEGVFSNCTIYGNNTLSNSVHNTEDLHLYLTRIVCTAITSLSNIEGKLNILNNAILAS